MVAIAAGAPERFGSRQLGPASPLNPGRLRRPQGEAATHAAVGALGAGGLGEGAGQGIRAVDPIAAPQGGALR